MLNELISLTRPSNFEQYRRLGLQAVTYDPADYNPDDYPWWTEKPDFLMRLLFNLNMADDERDSANLGSRVCRRAGASVLLGRCDEFNLYDDHVLLWSYKSPKATVSFLAKLEILVLRRGCYVVASAFEARRVA